MPLQVKSLAEWEREGLAGMLSVVIPAHNEEGHIRGTVESVVAALEEAGIRYEILVVDDNSVDRTEKIVRDLARANPAVRHVSSEPPNGAEPTLVPLLPSRMHSTHCWPTAAERRQSGHAGRPHRTHDT